MSVDDPFRRRRAIETRASRDAEQHAHTPLGAGGEFDAIRRMLERWGPRARGIGDDAAVVTSLGERALVASTDTSVENVHFRSGWLTPQEIGFRATAAALSDLAAMGATPLGILIAISVPEAWRRHLDAITDGIGEAASAVNAPILGGDMSRGSELSITVTALGAARDVLFRTSARAGDTVYVTGRLGGPLAALREFSQGREPAAPDRERFARPMPRVAESIWLGSHGAAAAIDISDGLSADLRHLASASRVMIKAELDRVPVVDGVTSLEAASSGEEYELIVTSRGKIDVEEFRKRFGLEITEIGKVEHGAGQVRFMLGGEEVDPPPGFSHFAEQAGIPETGRG